MSGGALAATHTKFVIISTKQIKPSVLKRLQGKVGTNGSPGPTGPQGPAGTAGAAGKAGTNGEVGKQGESGKAGEGVVSSELEAGERSV